MKCLQLQPAASSSRDPGSSWGASWVWSCLLDEGPGEQVSPDRASRAPSPSPSPGCPTRSLTFCHFFFFFFPFSPSFFDYVCKHYSTAGRPSSFSSSFLKKVAIVLLSHQEKETKYDKNTRKYTILTWHANIQSNPKYGFNFFLKKTGHYL